MGEAGIIASRELDDDSPSAIRAAMAETRRELAGHLTALKDRLLRTSPADEPVREPDMAAPKKTKQSSPPAPKSKSNAKTKAKPATSETRSVELSASVRTPSADGK